MPSAPAFAIAREVAAGTRTAVASATDALERAIAYDSIQPQAWIARVPAEELLENARLVDERLKSGESLALAGVPFAVKDNIDVQGMDTTVGCPAFAFSAAESATVVRRLQEAGALLMGKTNLDQFATGLVGTRTPYGATGCVFNREYVSGGSSSGSAVLVAAGVVPFALGSDTAGSGRVPAAFNALVGFKPTRGRWSSHGLFPACRSLDCVSVFASNTRDAALVDETLAAFDDTDPYARRAPAQAPTLGRELRMGVPRPGQLQFLGDAEAPALFDAALERLAEIGARAVEIDIEPLLAAAQLLYAGPWIAERLAAIGPLLQRQAGAVHPVVRAIIQAGAGVSGADVFRGMHVLQQHLRMAERLWQEVDVLVLPTSPTIYRIAEVLAEPVALNSILGLYTNFVNLLDMSAIALPAGFRANATGFGASLIGPAWADRVLLELARRYEERSTSAPRPPLDLKARPAQVQLAVAGAHLSGLPLNWQLSSRGARLVCRTKTAPQYRLYAIVGQSPARPALVHCGPGSSAIEIEIYEMETAAFGSFVAEVAAPLAIGKIVLADGASVPGFVAEPRAIVGAQDISALGGWRAYLAQQEKR